MIEKDIKKLKKKMKKHQGYLDNLTTWVVIEGISIAVLAFALICAI